MRALPGSRVTARYLLGAGPCFELATPELVRVFRLSAGWREFTLDAPLLDRRFSRIGDDPAAIRRAFPPDVLERLAALLHVRIHSDGTHVELYHPRDDAHRLWPTRDLVERIAAVDAGPAHAALRDLPDAVFHERASPPFAELPDLRARVLFTGEAGRRVTRVMRELAPEAEGASIALAPGEAAKRLPPEARARLAELGQVALRCAQGWASITFDGVVTDGALLLGAARVCQAMASGFSLGVYR